MTGKKKVVIPREKDIPLDELLSGVGLTVNQWQTYLAILEQREVATAPEVLETLTARGLLRPSLERELGFAPIPPGPAFSRLMERYDEDLIQRMKAGMQLRKLMRGVSEAKPEVHGARDRSGIEMYEDINEARDRIYELFVATPGRTQVSLETRYRPRSQDDPIALTGYDPVADASNRASIQTSLEAHLMTVVVDRLRLESTGIPKEWESAHGERLMEYPGELPQLIFREASHLVLWRDPFPSRSATLIVTSGWALQLAATYIDFVLALSTPWAPSNAQARDSSTQDRVADLLCRGFSDDQIATRCGLSQRTVGRHVAALALAVGGETRFQTGMLLERRRLAARNLREREYG